LSNALGAALSKMLKLVGQSQKYAFGFNVTFPKGGTPQAIDNAWLGRPLHGHHRQNWSLISLGFFPKKSHCRPWWRGYASASNFPPA
jgi:hypothetical protein